MWGAEHDGLLARYPHLALREVLVEVAEAHDASSWPHAHQDDLLAWVDGGDYDHPPPPGQWWIYRSTPRRTFDRMVALRREAHGWWRYDPKLDAPVWQPDAT